MSGLSIANHIINRYIDKLLDFTEERASMILGVEGELKKLQIRLVEIRRLLEDAEKKRHADATVDLWLKRLKDFMYDAEDIIEHCMIEGHKLLEEHQPPPPVRCHDSVLSCITSVPFRNEIAVKVRDLNSRLKEIQEDSVVSRLVPNLYARTASNLETSQMYRARDTTPMLVESDIVGRKIVERTRSLAEMIISKKERNKCCFFAITGMGGIGKTTLASKLYNDHNILANFPTRIWVCVRKEFDERRLLRQIIQDAMGSCGENGSKTQLEEHLASMLTQRFLLVLDNVWSEDVWEGCLRAPFENGVAEGRVLITTRDETLARRMGASIHRVGRMSKEDGWAMICKRVFRDGEEEDIEALRDIGMRIVDKCDGLPLAIKAMAGVLRSKDRRRREWEEILSNKAWSMTQLPEELRGALYLSYEDLSPELKQCFLFCSLLHEKVAYFHKQIIKYWMAEGFISAQGGDKVMEEVGEDYYRELIGRNLLQPHPHSHANTICTMHDLVRSLGRFLTHDENLFIDAPWIPKIDPLIKLRRLAIKDIPYNAVASKATNKHLRTLLLFCNRDKRILGSELFPWLNCLRILDVSYTGIESVPNSIESLVHLRFLNLSGTMIDKLPETLGCLSNLQTLIIDRCQLLHELPKGITRLHNLRCLTLEGTPLSYLPSGVCKLKNLIDLRGFFVGNNNNISEGEGPQDAGCSLEDLQSLRQLRELGIVNLKDAQTGNSLALAEKSFLRTLLLSCSFLRDEYPNQPPYTEEEIKRIEDVFEELFPPKSVEILHMWGYFGRTLPNWMLSPTLESSLSCLTWVLINGFTSCVQLPPLGQLPQLEVLCIEACHGIVSIGPEVMGCHALGTKAAFPKLKNLSIRKMPNWEEWSLGGGDGTQSSLSRNKPVLPRLKYFEIKECPKLRALPQGLLQHATKLDILLIQGAHGLRDVQDIPSVQEIILNDNLSLQSVSKLPSTTSVVIVACPSLERVDGLNALRRVTLAYPPASTFPSNEDSGISTWKCFFYQPLPKWLHKLVNEPRRATRDLQSFTMYCPTGIFLRCLKDAPDWHVIQRISKVYLRVNDGSGLWLNYTKTPFKCDSNAGSDLKELATTSIPRRRWYVPMLIAYRYLCDWGRPFLPSFLQDLPLAPLIAAFFCIYCTIWLLVRLLKPFFLM